ncbi:exported hypothetical protein [Syntrophobacter sp. SbD1]|nr:exported hypothetical protein [Syntrophobacter sp. SbD1]
MKNWAFLFLALCCACVLMGQKSVYIWTDEHGTRHVSDRKPNNNENVHEMKYKPRPCPSEPEQSLASQ